MKKIAIVLVAYNRVDGLARLVDSLQKADYIGDAIDLIISIDNSSTDDVEVFSKTVEWAHGKKMVRTFSERQGLRNHILSCGDFLFEYDAIVVLEDDLFVSPGFYYYVKASIEKYCDSEKVAGISLYTTLWDTNSRLPFQPAYTQFDVFFQQKAQSWGQVWMKKQWFSFKEWYQQNNEPFYEHENLPNIICRWPETSWLKYHVKYCVEQNKYFAFPYKSLTTCFADVGQHCHEKTPHFHVPLLTDVKKEYCLPNVNDPAAARYDVFYERVLPTGAFDGISYDDICVDLYGSRKTQQGKRYLLSVKELDYKIIATFALEFKPQEVNFLFDLKGDIIKLYDLQIPQNNKLPSVALTVYQYHSRWYSQTKLQLMGILGNLKSKYWKRLFK